MVLHHHFKQMARPKAVRATAVRLLICTQLALGVSVTRAQGGTAYLPRALPEESVGPNVICWGDGTDVPQQLFTKVEDGGSLWALEVGGSPGDTFVCGLARNDSTTGIDGRLFDMVCFGKGKLGQLGTGSFEPSATPAPVFIGQEVMQAGLGPYHACAVDTNGTAWCWGEGSSGELGDGRNKSSVVPVPVSGGLYFASVGVGHRFSCGLAPYRSEVTEQGTYDTGGPAWCWGAGTDGQLGDGKRTDSSVPVEVEGGHFFSRIETGATFACGLETGDNTVWCWGRGPGFSTAAPQQVVGGGELVAITAGADHMCGLTDEGKALCWGFGDVGQLGNNKTQYYEFKRAVEVAGNRTWLVLAAGVDYTCGLDIESRAWCWGLGAQGQLGNGQTRNTTVPIPVLGNWTFADLSAGYGKTCGIVGQTAMYEAAPAPLPEGALPPEVSQPDFSIPGGDDVTVPTPAAPPPSTRSDSSSSFPVGAVAGGVGAAVVVATLLAFLALRPGKGWLRRRRPEYVQPPASPGSGPAVACDTLLGKPPLAALPSKARRGGMSDGDSASNLLLDGSLPTTCSGASLDGDPVLTFISGFIQAHRPAHRPAAGNAEALSSRAAHGGYPGAASSLNDSARTTGSGSVALTASSRELSAEVQLWEVAWEDIQLARVIGQGSFGRVYLGVWRGVPVAVKILINQDLLTEEGLEMSRSGLHALQEEAAVMARMRHPNIVNFLGLCSLPPCIITEFCSRGSLYDLLMSAAKDSTAAQQLTWRKRLQLALDAATGLLYLHSMSPPVVHRDVKSPNILVDASWRGRIADFNLSRLEQQVAPGGVASSMGGAKNPCWLAPEVLAGERASVKADTYSFGLVMFELLTWSLPWTASGASVFQVAHMVLKGERPAVPPRQALPGADTAGFAGLDAYCDLMRECWAQAPDDRPAFDAIVPRLCALLDAAVVGPSG